MYQKYSDKNSVKHYELVDASSISNSFLALLPLPTSVHFIFALRISFLIIKGYNCTILRSIEQNTIIGGQLIHNIVLVSVTHQHQAAIDIHVSSPF